MDFSFRKLPVFKVGIHGSSVSESSLQKLSPSLSLSSMILSYPYFSENVEYKDKGIDSAHKCEIHCCHICEKNQSFDLCVITYYYIYTPRHRHVGIGGHWRHYCTK